MSRAEGSRNQYSSRGIGIPVGGAIGGGDDFAQRIGKPYQPKPFRSQGGFEGSADSTFSYKLGRHNVDDLEGTGDSFNVDSIVTRKIAGPRRLPRGFKMSKQSYGNLADFEELGDHAITSAAMQFESKLHDYVDAVLNEIPDDEEDEQANEFSGAGAIAGYITPLGTPARSQDFYKRMAKPYGGTYLVDPKKIKARP